MVNFNSYKFEHFNQVMLTFQTLGVYITVYTKTAGILQRIRPKVLTVS